MNLVQDHNQDLIQYFKRDLENLSIRLNQIQHEASLNSYTTPETNQFVDELTDKLASTKPASNENKAKVNFLGVGFQKAGTTWLYSALQSHQRISLHPIKELHFFDSKFHCGGYSVERRRKKALMGLHNQLENYFNKTDLRKIDLHQINKIESLLKLCVRPYSIDTYLSLFSGIENDIVGEITPSYSTLNEKAIQYIRNSLGNIKIIMMIRNPVSRAWSSFRFHHQFTKKNLNEMNDQQIYHLITKDKQWLKNCDDRCNYDRAISLYSKYFNDIKYIIYDDIVREPIRVIHETCQYFNIDYNSGNFKEIAVKKMNEGKIKIEIGDQAKKFLLERYENQINFLKNLFDRDDIIL
ncbi:MULTISPECIES: sulfotransferase [Limnospira]|uniref:sulfotransferase n=1 Tax=Limnospira TaxID=2596745 RepID=UPI00028042B5|nr:sulfotransferase [Limnospira sp. PMC 894.15]EKD08157.1 hypothetical protein SPLC1_S270790 [Arthrospira platensis C1]MDT9188905.1 sulfotransferase [Limnospira sp. PMC 894.15]UWU46927.1 Sulfotransferase family protein [Arthrospira platensis C1]